MDSKGFIQLFNTKWSNTNLHYSKSAYSSYATDLVLCETWTNLSEHTRQLSTAHCKGPSWRPLPEYSPDLQPTVPHSNHCGSAQGFKGDSAPGDVAQAEPSQTEAAAVTSPTQPQPLRAGSGAPHSFSTMFPKQNQSWNSPASQAPASKGDVGSSKKGI